MAFLVEGRRPVDLKMMSCTEASCPAMTQSIAIRGTLLADKAP